MLYNPAAQRYYLKITVALIISLIVNIGFVYVMFFIWAGNMLCDAQASECAAQWDYYMRAMVGVAGIYFFVCMLILYFFKKNFLTESKIWTLLAILFVPLLVIIIAFAVLLKFL